MNYVRIKGQYVLNKFNLNPKPLFRVIHSLKGHGFRFLGLGFGVQGYGFVV